MKKMVRISQIVVLFLLVALSACQDTKDIFDGTPSEKRKEYFDNLQSTLLSAESGWIMQYFPTVNSPGYNLFVDFDETGEVILGANNPLSANVYAEYTSRYKVGIENGPMLSFVTYNELLHPFSDPDIVVTASGDFEFRILEVTKDQIKLAGKKSNASVWLNRLPGTTTGEEYIAQSDAMKDFLFAEGSPDLYLETADKTFPLSNGYTSILSIKDSAVHTAAAVVKIPYVATPTGLRLQTPLETGNLKMQDFRINEDQSALVCTNANARIVAKDRLPDFFFSNIAIVTSFPNRWKIDKNNLKGTFADVYTQIVENCRSEYNEDFGSFYFFYQIKRKILTLSFKSGKYEGAFDFAIDLKEGTDNEIVFTYKGTADHNGNFYLTRVPGFRELIDALVDGSYKVKEVSSLSLTSITLVSVSNPENGIRLSLN